MLVVCGQVIYLELEWGEWLEAYPEIMQKFIDAGWLELFYTFQGYHEEVSMLFAKKIYGFQT